MDDLEYTKEDLFTRAIMLEDSNSLTIYVEDQNKEYEYETIFKRMLDENDLKDKLQIKKTKIEKALIKLIKNNKY